MNLFEGCVYEDTDSIDEGGELIDYFESLFGVDVSRALFVEVETEHIGSHFDGGGSIVVICQATDFYFYN